MSNHKSNMYSEFNMDVIASRYVECGDWWTAENLACPFNRIYMVTSGVGYLEYAGKSITLMPGNIYVIPAGLQISYFCEQPLCKTYFHVSLPLQNGCDLFDGIDTCFVFSSEELVTEVARRLNSNAINDIIYIKSILYSLIHRCIEGNVHYLTSSYSKSTIEAMNYIKANLSSKLTTEDVATALFISLERLRKTFRAETGVPIGKYINNTLMSKAELEVRRGELSIKEISDMLGFCDQFYFSRYFSEKYGIPPSKYRNKVNAHQ